MARKTLRTVVTALVLFLRSALCGFCLMAFPAQASDSGTLRPDASTLLIDDGDRHSLIIAAERQVEYLKTLADRQQWEIGHHTIRTEDLRRSMHSFLSIIRQEESPDRISARLRDAFTVIPTDSLTSSEAARKLLVTGYFEPIIEGSTNRSDQFRYPIYRKPADLIPATGSRQFTVGRKGSSGLVPYWSRKQIETESPLAGNELVYLKDPVEAFILHIQGSGKVRLRDGSLRSLRFSASNGHPYRSIGKLLVDEGKLTFEEATLPGIERYLRDHPKDLWRILHSNPRYIFFAWGEDDAVRGSSGLELTPGRSIAVDPAAVPLGAVAFISTRRPVFDEAGRQTGWQPLRRFVFSQDSGAAIKGPGRVDLFLGSGQEARDAAGLMRENGEMFILLKK